LPEAKIRFLSNAQSTEIKNMYKKAMTGEEKLNLIDEVRDQYGKYGDSAIREAFDQKVVIMYNLTKNNSDVAKKYLSIIDSPVSKTGEEGERFKKNQVDVGRYSAKKNNLLNFLQEIDRIYGTNNYFNVANAMAKYSTKYEKQGYDVKDSLDELERTYGGKIYSDNDIVSMGYNVSDATYKAKKDIVNNLLKSGKLTEDQARSLRRSSKLVIDGDNIFLLNGAGIPFKKISTEELLLFEQGIVYEKSGKVVLGKIKNKVKKPIETPRMGG